ncbi:thiamine-phosphate kinase [Gimesia panareensis]|uniref:Thiamine-monophosphate kinase n=1 Tax=Gimesia panareensis TaxID=2527978 RepID=A0A517Q5H6_9PLAN|nr:thiamine-phosphate kinase [Gimesia panareensis]QDT26883.1 Thiamine-monophosphate kinase [Gimesia panareensis]QDU50268.1 Thiamine-monophosphate kinase [Gimesia panareensis]
MAAAFNEFELIDWIQSRCPVPPHDLLSIGDDTAVVPPQPGRELLLATDMLMEGTHFTFPPATPELAGRKALAVNLSDIAAMAGEPHSALVSLALPRSRGADFAKAVMQGLIDLAKEYRTEVIGGDTNSWEGPLVINVALLGTAPQTKSIMRSSAHAGDWIFVTGELGGSLASHHLTFTPRVREAAILKETVSLHAMIDISDGLASDLQHILTESGMGAVIRSQQIPISQRVSSELSAAERLQKAVSDGEDFELLFTVSPEEGQRLLEQNPLAIPLTHLGEITSEEGAFLEKEDGSLIPLERTGWQHQL